MIIRGYLRNNSPKPHDKYNIQPANLKLEHYNSLMINFLIYCSTILLITFKLLKYTT